MRPAIWWVGRDLRLADNPALTEAARRGPVIALMLLDRAETSLGAAAGWRLAQAMTALDTDLQAHGGRLVVRMGAAEMVLPALIRETGAAFVHLNSGLPFFHLAPDTIAAVERAGAKLCVHPGNWLCPPGKLRTGTGGGYRKFMPFWKNLRARDISAPLPVPAIRFADAPDGLAVWPLGQEMRRGAAALARVTTAGEGAAQERLAGFLDSSLMSYATDRDRPDLVATSGLSDALAVGEVSARTLWHAARARMGQGVGGAERFLSELAWRDFARDLYHHAPDMAVRNWNPEWDGFPWRADNSDADAWRWGETGIDLVDAGMRELYATGRMHNRVRMVVASFLSKHLLTDWRVGLGWFADTLTDWDPASNAMNWQWVAGSGPDAAPYFRIFNPERQAETFDPKGAYRAYWLKGAGAETFAQAIPASRFVTRPLAPIVGLAEGRARALDAYERGRI